MAKKSGAILWPRADLKTGASRTRREKDNSTTYSTLYSVGLAASYEVDLWSRLRSSQKAAWLDVQAQGAAVNTAAITMAASIANTWYQLAEANYQPIIVMIAIPFGIVGAVLGHMLMGYALSLMSMMGIVALSGVVVNDSLILIDYANRQRRKGVSPFDAIHQAGGRRFRPILLTTLTTFGGLAPMIFETSRQARFMIPMAISLEFGILFATSITLVIVPCLYLMAEDVRRVIRWLPPTSHEPTVTHSPALG